MNPHNALQTSRLFTVALITLALSACAANTPQRLCHGPLTSINKAPINKAPINTALISASTPPSATR